MHWIQEPPPVKNDMPAVWQMVIKDMVDRDHFGREKYGTPLQPMNGRNSPKDAYEEVLDLAVYMKTTSEEIKFLDKELRELMATARAHGNHEIANVIETILSKYGFFKFPKMPTKQEPQ